MNIAQGLENLKLEQDAIALYDALAAIDKDPRRAAAFRQIAANERHHADIWARRLRELGATVPPAGASAGARPVHHPRRARARDPAVGELVQSLEGDEVDAYETQETSPELVEMAADEREHAEIWKRLGDRGGRGRRGVARCASPCRRTDGSRRAEDGGRRHTRPPQITRREGWHRTARSGTLRAVIFGVSDGLVSNLSLVMGVAGASGQDDVILLAGIAGLLAGACSMAAGEYISMQSQRELFERQIALERAEVEAVPREEQRELAAIYAGKGVPRDEAERLAARMFEDPEVALDTLVREELGLDPDELGSPWGAATGSFLAFAAGAIVPVLPYLFATGTSAFAVSLGLSLGALFAVGAAVSLLTGRSLLFSGLRQMGIGAAAAGVTFVVGRVIGVGVAG